MTINLTNAGKRYNREWIFRNFTYTFLEGSSYAITGSNGSGKSTLLQAIAGSLEISEGKINWEAGEKTVEADQVFTHFTIAAPYLEVIEEMTAMEFLQFHHHFKKLIEGISIKEILSIIGLEKAANKQIRYYSSGMKQRVKLAQAVFSDVPLLLLDEPCTNLDATGYELYHRLITEYAADKTIIVSSNDANEYSFCRHIVKMSDYKK